MTDVFADVAARVLAEHPGDDQARMLHSPGLRTPAGFYAFAPGPDVIVKLPAARVRELIGAGDGEPCSPRPGHPMREWVRLPDPDEQTCLARVLEARAFLTGT